MDSLKERLSMGGVLFPSQIKNKSTNAEKLKSREEVGLEKNVKLSDNDKKDTSKDKGEKVKVTPFKDTSMGKNTDSAIKQQVDKYVEKRKVPINKDLTIDKSAEGKAKKLEASIKKIRETEPENQSKEFGPGGQPKASVQIKKARLAGKTGVERAQELAKMRIAAGKSIQDVKDANTDAMQKRAAKRFADFKAKREAKRLARMKEEYTSYDLVLEYLMSTEQAATIEEANYIMTEMDSKTIQSIISD